MPKRKAQLVHGIAGRRGRVDEAVVGLAAGLLHPPRRLRPAGPAARVVDAAGPAGAEVPAKRRGLGDHVLAREARSGAKPSTKLKCGAISCPFARIFRASSTLKPNLPSLVAIALM